MRGIHFAVALPIIILSSALLIVIACSNAPEPTPTPVPVVEPTATPTPVPLTPAEVAANAAVALSESGSMWFLLDHENGFTESLGGLELHFIEGAITDNALSVKAEANLGRIYIEVEAISIDDETWMTNPLTGEWEPFEDENNPLGFIKPIEAVMNILNNLIEPEFSVEAKSSGAYTISASLAAENLLSLLGEIKPGAIAHCEVVIDSESFQLKSAKITGAVQNQDTPETIRIVDLSRYGEDFGIVQPTE